MRALRAVALIVALAGCNQILGVPDPSRTDGDGGTDAAAIDAMQIDAWLIDAGAARIVLTSGNGQAPAMVGTALAPFVVTVEDPQGNPIENFVVTFAITTTGGNLSATNVVTSSLGRASTTLTLSTTAGTNTVEARAAWLAMSPVVFDATGLAGPATQIALASGA